MTRYFVYINLFNLHNQTTKLTVSCFTDKDMKKGRSVKSYAYVAW